MNNTDAERWESACRNLSIPVEKVFIIPFSLELPPIRSSRPYLFLGSTTMVSLAYDDARYSGGVFFDYETFKPSVYADVYGCNYLNRSMEITTLRDFMPSGTCLPDREFFVKCNNDSKQITGGVMTVGELLEIKGRMGDDDLFDSRGLFTLDSELCLSPVQEICEEYRLVIVDGRVVASSQYAPVKNARIPFEVIRFGNFMARSWGPHQVYVMDVCSMPNRCLKVVECNCFNASGLYECNYEDVLTALMTR